MAAIAKPILFALLSGLLLAGCPAPGEGRNFERARAQAEPVFDALDRYRAATGAYPETLVALEPTFVPAGTQAAHDPGGSVVFRYNRISPDQYEFELSYSGPGMNHCSFAGQEARKPETWRCFGYY